VAGPIVEHCKTVTASRLWRGAGGDDVECWPSLIDD
jgi:hypothetical protein